MSDPSFKAFVDELSKTAGIRVLLNKMKDIWRPASEVAKRKVETHFATMSPTKWDKFLLNVQNNNYLQQLAEHPLTDTTLLTHAQSMHNLAKGETVAVIRGSSGKKYDIIELLGGGGLGCTCNDWRFKGSVLPGYECKHIQAYKAGKTKV